MKKEKKLSYTKECGETNRITSSDQKSRLEVDCGCDCGLI